MRVEVDLPDGRQTLVLTAREASMSIAEAMRRKNIPLNTRCGEKDLCKGCVVELVSGAVRRLDTGDLVTSNAQPIEITGCRTAFSGEIALIRVPERSLLAYKPQVVGDYRINVPYARAPLSQTGLGVAIDIGTTTVVVQVVDGSSGKVLGRASDFNKQMRFADDVLTRINLCSSDPSMTAQLQDAIVAGTVQPLLDEALSRAGHVRSDVACFVIAGNTTMLHLFCGVDPSSMGIAPFRPSFIEHRKMVAKAVGLEPAEAAVHLLPGAGAYVGADLTSGVFASGLVYEDGPSLLVDVGTNGEIILKRGQRLYGCATAAGPAFEGSGLSSGVRAGKGAISHIRISTESPEIEIEVIGGRHVQPTGICGSAYVDLLSEARRVGLLSHTGRFEPAFVGSNVERFREGPYGKELVLGEAPGGRPITVSEADIARLLQAKAAVAAGILTLLRKEGVATSDVQTLHLAGGFGMHMRLESAIGSGLLPGFGVSQVQLVGNTSLAGATIGFLDGSSIEDLSRIGAEMELVELNLDPEFEDTYIDQLSLPQAT